MPSINEARLQRILELKDKPKPPQILELKEKIEIETRLLELHASISSEIDEDKINEIVNMKIRLDYLYAKWIEGEL